jgi:hypothetical protein
MDATLKEVDILGDEIRKYYSLVQNTIKVNNKLPENLILEYHLNKDACLVLIPETEEVFHFFDMTYEEHPQYDIVLDKKVLKEALGIRYISMITDCEDYPELL